MVEEDLDEKFKDAADPFRPMNAEEQRIDWRKRQRSRAAVRVEVESQRDRALPNAHTADLYKAKCDAIYQYIFESYFDDGSRVYRVAA